MKMMTTLSLLASGLMLGSVALADDTTATTTTTSTATTMTDGDIAAIMKTANEAEIAAAKEASKKADNKEVKEFASHMMKEHSANEKEGKTLEKKNNIKTEKNDTAMTIKKGADEKMAEMKKLKGAEFDKAYIDDQVSMHQELLTKLDSTLIPAAQNADLKTFLETTKTHVQQHLAMAQKIQSSLTK